MGRSGLFPQATARPWWRELSLTFAHPSLSCHPNVPLAERFHLITDLRVLQKLSHLGAALAFGRVLPLPATSHLSLATGLMIAGLSVHAWSLASAMSCGASKFGGKMIQPQSFSESSAT